MPKTKEQSPADQAKVKEIRDNFEEDFQHWEKIYREGDENMKFIAGDPWKSEDRQAREQAGRPVVTFDELGQYLNQAVNEVRMNPRAPKFSPESEGATDATAEFYGNLMRKTEYRSNAQEAYTTCYENGLQRGFGFVRLKLEYEHPRSFYQHVTIEPVPNPACCFPDCNSVRADGSDWARFTFIESYTKAEFERTFKEAEFTDFSAEQMSAVGSRWMGENRVQVAEYWEVEFGTAELTEYEVPATMTKPQRYVTVMEGERKPRGGRVMQQRVTETRTVRRYITNGVELLSKGGEKIHTYPGSMIPFAPCYGKIVWLNNGSGPERRILAMTSLAREPYAAYCFAAACELEAIGTITKNPYWAYEGQLDMGQKNRIKESLHQPVAVLEAKARLEGLPGVLLPLPQRNPMSVDLSAYAIAKEGARRAIQAAMGWTPLPSQAQRKNDKSGVALKQIEESGQRGAYHFIDHYNDMIRRVGVLFEDVVDKIYDVEREVTVLEADKSTKRVMVNPDPRNKQQLVDKDVDVLPSTKGRHAVTVDVGPEFESEREESAAFLDNFVGSPLFGQIEPPKRDKFLAMAIRNRVLGPEGTKMADIIDPQDAGDGPPPEQLKAMLMQAQKEIIPALEAEIQHLQQAEQARVTETQGKLAIAAQTDKTKVQIAAMQVEQKRQDNTDDNETAILIQQIKNQIARLELRVEREIEGAKLEHSAAMAERGHEQAEREGDKDRTITVTEAERNRQSSAAEGDKNRSAAEKAAAAKKDTK